MYCGKIRISTFGVASGNSTPFFEITKSIFHQVPQFVEVFVIFALQFAIAARWNLRLHTLSLGLLDDGIAVIPLVSNEMLCRQPLNQAVSLRTIRHGTRCNKDSDRHTMRIHGQMQLGVEPPFVLPIC